MEKETNLNKAPAAKELSDESLDAVTGGSALKYYDHDTQVEHSYKVGQWIVAVPPGEKKPRSGYITKKTSSYRERGGKGYVAAYEVKFIPGNRQHTIDEDEIQYVVY